jgi:hypothetical protein
MRHPSMYPIRSPGPTIAKNTPLRIGQIRQISGRNSTKKMRLICLDRIGLRPGLIHHLRGSAERALQLPSTHPRPPTPCCAAREQLSRTLHKLLLPADDHRRMTPNSATVRPGSCAAKAPLSPLTLELRAVLIPLCTLLPCLVWDRSAFRSSRCPKSGTAAEDHRRAAPPMHFPQICSVRTRFGLESVASPRGGSTGMHCFHLFAAPQIGVSQRKRVSGATHATSPVGFRLRSKDGSRGGPQL